MIPTYNIGGHRGAHVPQDKLKVGGIYICGDENHNASSCWRIGDYAVPFTLLDLDNYNHFSLDKTKNQGCGCSDLDHLYEWIVDEIKTSTMSVELTAPKKTLVSNIIEKIKNLTLSADDKLLRKYEVENEKGEPTEEGLKLACLKSYKTFRAEIIADLEELDAEEKAEKK